MAQKNCPICHKELFSEMGKACKLCGMVLLDKSRDYCCRLCRVKFSNFENIETKQYI